MTGTRQKGVNIYIYKIKNGKLDTHSQFFSDENSQNNSFNIDASSFSGEEVYIVAQKADSEQILEKKRIFLLPLTMKNLGFNKDYSISFKLPKNVADNARIEIECSDGDNYSLNYNGSTGLYESTSLYKYLGQRVLVKGYNDDGEIFAQTSITIPTSKILITDYSKDDDNEGYNLKFRVPGLTKDTNYEFSVKAKDKNGHIYTLNWLTYLIDTDSNDNDAYILTYGDLNKIKGKDVILEIRNYANVPIMSTDYIHIK